MALARIKTWVAGDVLTAANLNGEFNNVLNNPIALISPTTGAINFNLKAHTNFVLENVGSDPVVATTGRVFLNTARSQVEVDDGTIIRACPTVSATALAQGTLAVVTSSATSQFGLLAAGSSGSVLTMSSGSAVWSAGTVLPAQSQVIMQDDFLYLTSAAAMADTFQSATQMYTLTSSTAVAPVLTMTTSAPGGAAHVTMGANAFTYSLWGGTSGIPATHVYSSLNPSLTIAMLTSINSGAFRIGLSTAGVLGSTDPANGVYFRTSAALGSTWFAVSRNAGSSFIIATTAVTSTAFQTFSIQFSSSGQQATVFTNSVSAGTFTSSQVPVGSAYTFGFGSSANLDTVIDWWQLTQARSTGTF